MAMSCNYESYSVSIIDVATQAVVATLPSQRRAGSGAFSPDGTMAFAVSVGVSPNDYLSVYNINGAASSLAGHIDLTRNLYGFYYNGGWIPNPAVSADGSTVVIAGANPTGQSAIVIDTNLLAIQAVVDLTGVSGSGMPWFAAINSAGDRACIVNGQDNLVHFIQLAGPASSLLHTMTPGQVPFNAIYSDDGAFVYVNNRDSNNIVVIDTTTYAIVQTVALPGEPEYMTKSGSTLFVMCAVNSPTNPTINTVSMAGASSALLSSYEKNYYGYFIGGHESPEYAMTNCPGWDTYSFLHDPAATATPTTTPTQGPTSTPGAIPATSTAGIGILLLVIGAMLLISIRYR
nr:hypothetical protein [bacterium]